MATAGSVIVDLTANTGSFQTDIDRAAKAMEKIERAAAKNSAAIDKQVVALQFQASVAGKSAAQIKLLELANQGASKAQLGAADAALKQAAAYEKGVAIGEKIRAGFIAIGVAAVAAAGLGAAAFDALIKSAGDFKDLEETVGSSAEDIASLAIAAATAGVSMESVTGATIKLTKGLVGVDDESKAAGAALAALGINVEDFKKLDPVGQYEAVGKALAGFADGAGKTAVAVALFGKSGAEQLKVFKALEEQGGRQIILTQKQIELADDYSDRQAKQAATLKLYAAALATEALPALTALTEATTAFIKELIGVDAAGQKLNGPNTVSEFAKQAAIGIAVVVESVIGLGKALRAIGGSFESVLADVQTLGKAAQLISPAGGNKVERFTELKEAFANRQKIAAEANQRYIDLWNYDGTKISDAVRKSLSVETQVMKRVQSDPTELARRGRGPAALPQVNFTGPEKAEKPKVDKTTEADRYVEALQKQLQKTQELTEVEKVYDDILAGRFENAKAGQAFQALALADELDRTKQLKDENKALVDEVDKLQAASDKLREAGKSVFEATRTPAEQYAEQLGKLNELLLAGAINTDTYSRAVSNLQDKFDEAVIKQKDLARSINQSFEGAFANSFDGLITGTQTASQAFKSFASSVIQDLARIASQDLAKTIFGGGQNGTGGIGGLFSGLSGLFGGSSTTTIAGNDVGLAFAGGGRPPVGRTSLVGEKGPELFVPSTAGTIVPNNLLGGGGQRGNTIIENHGARIQEKRQPNGDMRYIVDMIRNEVAGGIASGTGPEAQALRARGVRMDGSLARRD